MDEDDPGKNDLDLHILDSNGDIYRTSTGSEIYEIVTLPLRAHTMLRLRLTVESQDMC